MKQFQQRSKVQLPLLLEKHEVQIQVTTFLLEEK